MKITVGMPVKPYLKKYIYWKENLPEDTVLELTYQSEIFMVLGALLSGKMTTQHRGSISDAIPKEYSSEIICRITPERDARGLLFYTLDNIRFFNTYLYKTFHDDLLYMILLNKEFGIDETTTIYTFMESLGIEDLITFDALKKASYRLRKERNLPVFRIVDSRIGENPHQFSVSA